MTDTAHHAGTGAHAPQGGGAIRVALVNDTSVDRHWGCTRVMRTLRALLRERGMNVEVVVPAHADWRRWAPALGGVDLIVANGEGTCHNDRPQGLRLLELGAFAAERGIPCALVNASWSNNSAAMAAALARWSLVSVRESLSAREAAAGGIDARVVPDLSLYFPFDTALERSGIGFSDSVVPSLRPALEALLREVGGRYVPVQYPADGPWSSLAFLRSVLSKRDLARPRTAWTLLAQRASELRQAVASEDAFLRAVASVSLLVTSRFHSMAIAIATRTPFLAVVPPEGSRATDGNKIRGLLGDIGLGQSRIVDPAGLDARAVSTTGAFTAEESARIDAFLLDGRRRTAQLFDQLAKMARPTPIPVAQR